MYAIIDVDSKQYKVEKDAEITVDRIDAEVNSTLEFDKVLFVHDDAQVRIGTPHVPNVKVIAQVMRHHKGEKIKVRTYKRRKDYHRSIGHRSFLTTLRITGVTGVTEGAATQKAKETPASVKTEAMSAKVSAKDTIKEG